MKKFLSLFLLIVLISAPGAGYAATPFVDIQGHKATESINAIYQQGIIIGTTNNKFSPNEYVTRAQLAVCLVKTFGLNYDDLRFIKEPVPSDLYNDVVDTSWYSEASMITGYNNIFKISDRKFEPNINVTRIDLASAITDSFKAKKFSVVTTLMWPNYSDISHLTNKQQSDIGFVFNTSIMKYEKNKFRPDDIITRAELAEVLNSTLKIINTAK